MGERSGAADAHRGAGGKGGHPAPELGLDDGDRLGADLVGGGEAPGDLDLKGRVELGQDAGRRPGVEVGEDEGDGLGVLGGEELPNLARLGAPEELEGRRDLGLPDPPEDVFRPLGAVGLPDDLDGEGLAGGDGTAPGEEAVVGLGEDGIPGGSVEGRRAEELEGEPLDVLRWELGEDPGRRLATEGDEEGGRLPGTGQGGRA
ncbi:MAG: hypothetical protein KatS3mg065_0785 [Chloroflexota bacterium]|nr:MAG: hypothetical protein KatS3mg065_0785 [Chloroflexota bacterium]